MTTRGVAVARRSKQPRDQLGQGLLLGHTKQEASPPFGEQQGADDRGEETSRRMNAGSRVARVACDCAYTPPSERRCFGPVVSTADWSTTRRCARLARGHARVGDSLLFSRGHQTHDVVADFVPDGVVSQTARW